MAALCASAGYTTSSHAAVVHWSNANLVIPATIDGLYINVETRASGSAGSVVAGWDINPYSATSLTWFNATGTGMMRYPGVTTGSAGNLAAGTVIGATGSYGSGAVTVGSAAGNWQLNAVNVFGFRFVGASGGTHYGYGLMSVGASITNRTITDIFYEDVAGASILITTATCPTLFRDLDGDGFGSSANGSFASCSPVSGYVSSNTDCDDSNAAINPNTTWHRDADGDTFGARTNGTLTQCAQPAGYILNNTDCDDNNAQINPNTTWYRDADGDGFGAGVNGTLAQCTQPTGYVLAGGDNCPSIANADQTDTNNNGLGDVCEFARGDLNLDGTVDGSDVPLFFNAWGSAGPIGDLNFDSIVNSADFTILLNNWGTQP